MRHLNLNNYIDPYNDLIIFIFSIRTINKLINNNEELYTCTMKYIVDY